MLRLKRSMLPIFILSLACSDANAPVIDDTADPASRTSLNFLRWDAGTGVPTFSATARSEHGEIPLADPPFGALYSGGAADYSVSFWAVRGELRTLDIQYQDLGGEYGANDGPFLRLEITEPVALPDGTPIAVGDSVLITVSVDSAYLVADLQPSGIQFGVSNPTELSMWYLGTDDDFDDDMDVDNNDANIQNNLLGLWDQEDPTGPWETLPSQHDVTNRLFVGVLEHFSGYAISW